MIIHADEVAPDDRPGGYDASSSSASEEEATTSASDESKLWTGKARVETFIVGQDVLAGERLQWIVEGGEVQSRSAFARVGRRG